MKTGPLLLATLLSMPTAYVSAQVLATAPVMAEGNHDAHDYSFGLNVPRNATYLSVLFDSRDLLGKDQTIRVVLERSFNGGLTYEPAGGQLFDSINQPSDIVVPLPQPTNGTRAVRGTVTLYGGKWKGKVLAEIQ
jgi:hypothetical protein